MLKHQGLWYVPSPDYEKAVVERDNLRAELDWLYDNHHDIVTHRWNGREPTYTITGSRSTKGYTTKRAAVYAARKRRLGDEIETSGEEGK